MAKPAWVALLLPLLLGSFYLFPIGATIDFWITGHIDVLKFSQPLTYWFWFGLVFVFQLTTWVLILDVLKMVLRLIMQNKKLIDDWHPRIGLLLFALVFLFVGWKTYHDSNHIITKHVALPVEKLPPALQDFKIIHISDLQGDEYTSQKEIADYIRKVNALQPDLIIFTGDLISYGTDFIQASAEAFGRARATYGTFAVVGDHDYWAGLEHIRKALAEEHIPLLRNQNRLIQVADGASVLITGFTQVYSKQVSAEKVDSLTRAQQASLKIIASHQVADHLISSARQQGYDMLLAGHTHGGQIRVPFMGMTFSAAEQETKYISGLYWKGELPIYVNNGLGFTLGPIRYNAPPEITVITLRPEE